MRRLRPLSEAECYARCYGAGDENVRPVRLERGHRRLPPRLVGDDDRRRPAARMADRDTRAA